MAVMVDDDGMAEQLVHTLITGGYSIFSSIEHDTRPEPSRPVISR